MLKLATFPLVALWLANDVAAWWDGGHYLSGCVARQTLIANKRQDVVDAVNKLVALYDDNGVTNDICRASCWMDWIKTTYSKDDSRILDPITAWGSQHYIDFLTTNETNGPTEQDVDIMLANVSYIHLDNLLSNAMDLGKEGHPQNYGTAYQQNLLMRWLLHLMGDAHMPLHMSSMYVYDPKYTCDGEPIAVNSTDAGGNGIRVKLEDDVDDDLKGANPTNLHALWDAMGGYGVLGADEINDTDMFAMASDLIANYPAAKAEKDGFKLKDFTLKDVYTKSAYLAGNKNLAPWDKQTVYGDVPIPDYYCPEELDADQQTKCCKEWPVTKEYGQWAKETSKKLVAIAGYRLADVLQKWYDGLSDRLIKDLDAEYNRQTSGASGLIMGSAAAAVVAGALLY